jgi:hypothetical protein
MKATLAWIIAVALLTGAGRVQTRDGKTVEGNVTLEDGAVQVGDTKLLWDQVTRLTLQSQPAAHVETARAGASLPDDWKHQDIGAIKMPGSATCDAKGTFNLTASGWGAWGAQDSLHFAWRTLEGDGQIIAHVAKLDMTHGPVVAGVMIRQSLAPDSPMAGACLYANGQVRLPRRPAGSTREFNHADEVAQQGWVRLTRRGDRLSALRSTDGKYWQLVESQDIPMNRSVLIGVAAWATGNAWLASAQFDSVRVIPGTPGLSYFPAGDPLAAGVLLRDGNALAGNVISHDESNLHFEREGKKTTLQLEQVARLIFSPLPPENLTPTEHRGILLTNGDFIEGDAIRIAMMQVDWPRPPQLKATVRSVLFGARSFEIAKEVMSVDLNSVAPAAAAYEVRTTDGSRIRAKIVTLRNGAIEVDGRVTADITDIRRI